MVLRLQGCHGYRIDDVGAWESMDSAVVCEVFGLVVGDDEIVLAIVQARASVTVSRWGSLDNPE